MGWGLSMALFRWKEGCTVLIAAEVTLQYPPNLTKTHHTKSSDLALTPPKLAHTNLNNTSKGISSLLNNRKFKVK